MMKASELMTVIVDIILSKLKAEDFLGEAINWGDLSCVDAYKHPTDGHWMVFIEQASPSATELQGVVSDRIKEHTGISAEVRTEW